MVPGGGGAQDPAAGGGGPDRWAATALFGRRRLAIGLAVSAALAFAAIALLGQAADYGRVWAALRRADLAWLAVGVPGFVIAYGGFALGYRDVARVQDGPALSRRTATRVVALGFAATLIGSTTGGLAMDAWRSSARARDGTGRHAVSRR